jgi:hypothetical protein
MVLWDFWDFDNNNNASDIFGSIVANFETDCNSCVVVNQVSKTTAKFLLEDAPEGYGRLLVVGEGGEVVEEECECD